MLSPDLLGALRFRSSAEIGKGAEGAIDQGLPPLPLGPDRLVKGRQQAEVDIAKP